MDVTKIYILMSEKAVKIQESKKAFFVGDYIVDPPEQPFVINNYIPSSDYQKSLIWLPRQDDLQSMVKKREKVGMLVQDLRDFIIDFGCSFEPTEGSMEQLWLAFVMSEKYSKQWSGTDWVKK